MNRRQWSAAQVRKKAIVSNVVIGDPSVIDDPEVMHNVGAVAMVIGCRGDLTQAFARETAAGFRQTYARHPQVEIALVITGYDDDPRELWEIPEVCRFMKWWAEAAGLSDWRIAETIPWSPVCSGLAFLVQCGVYGDNHPFVLTPRPKPN